MVSAADAPLTLPSLPVRAKRMDVIGPEVGTFSDSLPSCVVCACVGRRGGVGGFGWVVMWGAGGFV